MKLLISLLVCFFLLPQVVLATPAFVQYQGRLFDSSGDPVSSGSPNMVVQVLDPSANCLLFEESHTISMDDSEGFFTVSVGHGTQNTSTAPNFSVQEIFSNSASFNDSNTGCGTYNPSSGDHRLLRVSIDGNNLTPDQVVSSTPFSLQAANSQTLGGQTYTQINNYIDQNWAGSPLPDLSSTPLSAGDSFRWDGSKWEIFQPGSATSITNVVGGSGLTDSGTTTKTVNVGAGDGITVNADSIEVNLGSGLQFNSGAVEVDESSINYNNLSNLPTIPPAISDSDDVSEGSTNLFLTGTERTKLSGIASGAEVNVPSDWSASSGDAQILNKPDIPDGHSLDASDGAPADALIVDGAGLVGINTASPQSTLQVNGYVQLQINSAAPDAADCDSAAEYGRMRVDADSGDNTLYLCTADGWQSIQEASGGGQASCPTEVQSWGPSNSCSGTTTTDNHGGVRLIEINLSGCSGWYSRRIYQCNNGTWEMKFNTGCNLHGGCGD